MANKYLDGAGDPLYGVNGTPADEEIPKYDAGDARLEFAADDGGAGGGDLVLIDEQAPTGATVTFSSIPNTYRDLHVVVRGRSNRAATFTGVLVQFNNDTGGNYDNQHMQGTNATVQAAQTFGGTSIPIGYVTGTTASSNVPSTCAVRIFDYRGTTFHKQVISEAFLKIGTSSGNMFIEKRGGEWRNSSAITEIDVICDSGSFLAGTVVSLYGIM
jgi:hypothetical protein